MQLSLLPSYLIIIFMICTCYILTFFSFNDPATTEIYTLSLHDALPISTTTASPGITPASSASRSGSRRASGRRPATRGRSGCKPDRKSTRLNSSHVAISYAVFCLKKKNKKKKQSKNEYIHTTDSKH